MTVPIFYLLLHHVEGHAEQRLVVAHGEHARRAGGRVLERAQQPRLAQHVMRGRRQRRPRRAPQHRARVPAPDQERDVRVALADALGLEPARADSLLVEERLERLAHEQRRELKVRSLLRRVHEVRHGHRARILRTPHRMRAACV
jgi:hypothetical protein